MISIRKFLSQDGEAQQALMHAVRVLVQGIGQCAVEGDSEDSARFRESMQRISDALAERITAEDLLVQAGSVLKALEEYNRRTTRQTRLQAMELQNMLKMLTSTIGVLSVASDANVGRLSEIEKQVSVASELDDVRVIKVRLSDCLRDIRSEAERQRRETGETIDKLRQRVEEARRHSVEGGAPRDIVTGLPMREEAEAALGEAGRSGGRSYAAVMVLDRLQALNLRFGREVGDSVLTEFVQSIRKQLPEGDRLFRWSGTALLALLPRVNSLECVRSEIGRMMDTKLEHTVQTASRSILVPIVARWSVFPMMAAPRLMYQKLDAFAALPGSRD